MKATVDEDACIGCALCADTSAEVFEMADDKACVKVAEVPKNAAGTCREAADNCPVEAIKIGE
jgi:ferredoxin